jgi:hypothetical protein
LIVASFKNSVTLPINAMALIRTPPKRIQKNWNILPPPDHGIRLRFRPASDALGLPVTRTSLPPWEPQRTTSPKPQNLDLTSDRNHNPPHGSTSLPTTRLLRPQSAIFQAARDPFVGISGGNLGGR